MVDIIGASEPILNILAVAELKLLQTNWRSRQLSAVCRALVHPIQLNEHVLAHVACGLISVLVTAEDYHL